MNDHKGTLIFSQKVPTASGIGAEPALGNPVSDGYVLSSSAAGVRLWINPVALSNATPQSLGIPASGISTAASRSDHVHQMPSANAVGAVPASGGAFTGNVQFGGGLRFNGGAGLTANYIYVGGATAGTTNANFGFFVAGQGSTGNNEGPYFVARGNTFSAVSGQRGSMFLVAGDVSSPTTDEGAIFFLTGGVFVVKSSNSGQLVLPSVPRNPSAGTISGYETGTVYADASNFLKVK